MLLKAFSKTSENGLGGRDAHVGGEENLLDLIAIVGSSSFLPANKLASRPRKPGFAASFRKPFA